MTANELEDELSGTSDKALSVSILITLLTKTVGAKKIDFMKQLVGLYKEIGAHTEFSDMAP